MNAMLSESEASKNYRPLWENRSMDGEYQGSKAGASKHEE